MAQTLDAWIHNFTVTECVTHRKGYTVYEIKSIVFPVFIPETLTCLTVWKRYNDVKKLHKLVQNRHRDLQLRGAVPEPTDDGFFRRFDPEVIQQRKHYILQLLDFIAQHPGLYKSHAFLQFFETSRSPNVSPLRSSSSNIASICSKIEVPFNQEYKLIDTGKDGQSYEQDIDDLTVTSLNSSSPGSDNTSMCSEATSRRSENPIDELDITATEAITYEPYEIEKQISSDYIYEAALEFSDAVRAEVSHNYRTAFESYKEGIKKLIEGAQTDVRAEQRRVAKDKIQKYLHRAEQIHECYLSRDYGKFDENLKSKTSDYATKNKKYSSIEISLVELSQFKVIRVLHGVMQVQDIRNQQIYIMKAIERPVQSACLQILPKSIPNMVSLYGFFVSDSTIYLLLQQASGGRLWDYIKSYLPYSDSVNLKNSLASLFSEPSSNLIPTTTAAEINSTPPEAFLDVLHKFRSADYCSNDNAKNCIPQPCDLPTELANNMEVLDLVNCSQKLIQSVSTTLETIKSRVIFDDSLTERKPFTEILFKKTAKFVPKSQCYERLNQTYMQFDTNTKIKSKCLPYVPECSIKRWASEIATALHGLHSQNVFCQDLHPTNLLLGAKGQIQLSYFSKSVDRQLNNEALDGLYVAPERPLSTESDWWSFGVILFELITGERFVDCHPGGNASYYEVQYPDGQTDASRVISEDAKDLLNLLIQTEPEMRIGWEALRNHRYFNNILWENID